MTEPDQTPSAQASGDALSPGCQESFARLAKLIRARPGKFQLLIADCRDEPLRDRLIQDLDAALQGGDRHTAQLRLNAREYPDFAAVERTLTALAQTHGAIHMTGGPGWFDAARWAEFNIRRESVAQRVKASLLLWLDPESIADLAKTAIDLWAWRAAVVAFDALSERLPLPEPDIRIIDDRTRAERTARIEFLHQTLLEPDVPDDMRTGFALEIGDLAASLGRIADAETAYRNAARTATDERTRAFAVGGIADILQARGQLDEALRIRREEQLPVYDRLGDVRSRAVTMGQIADILQARGQLDEALRIRREEELPVYDRLGDVRSRAVTLYKIADSLIELGGLGDARAQAILDAVSESFTIARQLNLPDVVAYAGALLAMVLARAGRASEAFPILDEAEAAFTILDDVAGLERAKQLRQTLTAQAGQQATNG